MNVSKAEKISELTTNRLSVYLRCLNDLAKKGDKTVSSDTLAERYHLNSGRSAKTWRISANSESAA